MSEQTGRRRRGEIMGSWLDGPQSVQAGTGYPGQRLGLPESGPGSVATLGKRLAATLIDLISTALLGGIAYLFNHHATVVDRNAVATAVLIGEWIFLWPTLGQTFGMYVVRIRLIGRDGRPPKVRWSLLRVLLFVIPPFIAGVTLDGDNRGIHDKASGVTVVNV